ncbi:EexN family lipoprotein [Caballeronia sp. TF1N1]|uniref:EexN family lipoprotein n=1 Tax=Caballeronia sp. TF1N1 TaxID=2878153 RepID=UPI001FD49A29|nr:EexN family lipoprotein [Caballeronia sp. TF1N1]
MKMKLTVIAACVLVGACDGSPPHDVPYYKANEAEQLAKIAQCDKDPGHLDLSPNCRNAHEAQNQKVFSAKNQAIPRL